VAVDRRGPKVGWVPQKPAHYQRLSPRENLELFARLERLQDARERAGVLLRQFELPDEKRPASRLSGGMVQRLNLAVALLAEPDVLVLDEPTRGVDPERKDELADLLRVEAGRRATLVATHDPVFAAEVADRRVDLAEEREPVYA
jgi:ABC-2 type transport system ATP-binding protein